MKISTCGSDILPKMDIHTLSDLMDAYKVRGLIADRVITGIIGHPLSHSDSPSMQNAAMKAAGVKGIYLTFDSTDIEHLRDVVLGYDIRGMNVTIPYKQKVIEQMDSISEIAERIGAVNTVINDDGEIKGENTDHIGIRYAFSNIDLKGKNVIIMGSGGAARAATYTFRDAGCDVSISGRNELTVNMICDDFGCAPYRGSVKTFDIIVNCTPIGLVDGRYPADIDDIHSEQIVFDMVYGHDTPLIKKAKKSGSRLVDGKEMLIGQGAESFHLWFDRKPDVDVMRRAIQ